MKKTHYKQEHHDEVIDLKEMWIALLNGKWFILSITTLVSIIAVIYSLNLPNLYQSKAILVPVESSSSISGALQSYGGLASLAGVSLPSQGSDSNSVKAIQKLNTLSFFENNILPNIFLPNLMALESWNHNNKELLYNNKIFNNTSNTWTRDISYPKKNIPSAQESYIAFQGQHMELSEDKKTGFVTISIKHQSPYIAKKWLELVVKEINSHFREKDKLEAQKAVDYLNKQISTTSFSEIKQVMAGLLQQQTQKLILIESSEYYVFDYIDPPAIMENKSEPRRSVICILASIMGFMLGMFLTILKYFMTKETDY